MNIGILTFHNANNYGAVLQAYGLQEVLKSCGHQVEFVGYENPLIKKRMSYFSLRHNSLPRVLKRVLLNRKALLKRKKDFNEFRNTYIKTSRRINADELKKLGYDLLIVGSDQIWNPLLTAGLDPVYWGEYSGKIPTISYAASSNDLSLLDVETKVKIGNYLRNFYSLGVREDRLKLFFRDNYSIDSTVVLDPTLLAGKNVFDKIADKRVIEEPYLCVYAVEELSKSMIEISLEIANKRGLKIVVLGSYSDKKRKQYRNAIFVTPSVPQFLSLFKYADCVVCRSFHGTAFSVIYEKDFYSVKGGNMARVESLLIPLNLTQRIVGEASDIIYDKIDYKITSSILSEIRELSMNYLLNNMDKLSR